MTGNGPAALIISYILHGHVPYYDGVHHDSILHRKLTEQPNLLDISPDLYAHFSSSLRYSTQALPVNTLLDTLIRPNADVDTNPKPCVKWKYEPQKIIPHIVLGNAPTAGGQWTDVKKSANSDIATLSYAEMLSLPGYTFADHYEAIHGVPLPDFTRPSRAEVAEYYRAYPDAVGVSSSLFNSVQVGDISRRGSGFYIGSLNVQCEHLILSSGIFSVNIPPPLGLRPLSRCSDPVEALLVVGSGFSAADVILSAPSQRKILHVFKWDPKHRFSPLRGCHPSAYPEYAGVYYRMKSAAAARTPNSSSTTKIATRPVQRRRRSTAPAIAQRDWTHTYEGLPNAEVVSIDESALPGAAATVTLRLESGETLTRTIGSFEYAVGRRGTLSYLDPSLLAEIVEYNPSNSDWDSNIRQPSRENSSPQISGRTLRARIEANDTEVAPRVYAAGSLAGDSLVRHAFGTSVLAASRVMREYWSRNSPPEYAKHEVKQQHQHQQQLPQELPNLSPSSLSPPAPPLSATSTLSSPPYTPLSPPASAPVGLAPPSPKSLPAPAVTVVDGADVGGHEDLRLDKSSLARGTDVSR